MNQGAPRVWFPMVSWLWLWLWWLTAVGLSDAAGSPGVPPVSPVASSTRAPTKVPTLQPSSCQPTFSPTIAKVLTTSTGSISYTVTSTSDVSTWIIQPAIPTSSIQIILESMTINNAQLRIYDTAQQSSGKSLINCVQCSFMLPPPYLSTSGSVTVFIQGLNALSFKSSSFSLSYIAIPLSYTQLPSTLSMNLNMGYMTITPIAVNRLIPNSSQQLWYLRQSSGTTITFAFDSLSLSSDCQDRLIVYDNLNATGNVLFSGCSSTSLPSRWFYSYTGFATIVFITSPSRVSTSSFALKYYTNTPWYSCGALSYPEVYSGLSQLIMDGSGSELERRGDSCSWLFNATTGNSVTLIMSQVSLKYGSSLVIYDGKSTSSYVLWSGTGATVTIPPIMRSSGTYLFAVFVADTSDPVRYTGFLGESYQNFYGSTGSGRGYTTLAMSSTLDITAPGSLSSASVLNYTWYIKPSIVSSTNSILTFLISTFNMSSGSILTLYDGLPANKSVIAVFAGPLVSPPSKWFVTTSRVATLTLTQPSTATTVTTPSTNGNFRMMYYSDGPNYHCGFTRNPAVVDAQSWWITDGSQSTEYLLTNQYCEWNLQVSRQLTDQVFAGQQGIHLVFDRFSVVGGSLLIYIVIKNKRVLYAQVADTVIVPAPVFIPYANVVLAYQTTSSATGYGFALTYYATNNANSFPGNDIVTITSASVVSLELTPSVDTAQSILKVHQQHAVNVNKTWLISPASSTGKIYVAFSRLYLPSCEGHELVFYDGATAESVELARWCGPSLTANLIQSYKWTVTSSKYLYVRFLSYSLSSNLSLVDFAFSVYSDGSNYQGGFLNNPAYLTAPSFIFSDGSSSTEALYKSQSSQWIVAPSALGLTGGNDSSASSPLMVILEFILSDLSGSAISVYERDSVSSDETVLLWQCEDCEDVLPPALIARKDKHFVVSFDSSSSSSTYGAGFTAIYWSINDSDWRNTSQPLGDSSSNSTVDQSVATSTIVLEVPRGLSFDSSTLLNQSLVYQLHVPLNTSYMTKLSFSPKYSMSSLSSSINERAIDGRPSGNSVFEPSVKTVPTCGMIASSAQSIPSTTLDFAHTLTNPLASVFYRPQQIAERFLRSSIDNKVLMSVEGVSGEVADASDVFQPLTVCKYWLESSVSNQAIKLVVTSADFTNNGRLRVFGGIYGNDSVLYDSNRLADRSAALPLVIQIPCGKSYVISERNATNSSTAVIDYSWSFEYVTIADDAGAICDLYIASLLPPVQKKDPNIPYYIAAGVVGACLLIFAVAVKLMQLKHKRGYLFYPKDYSRSYSLLSKEHPLHFGTWTDFFNRLALHKGYCCICNTQNIDVFSLTCTHALCVDDLQNYVNSALGDISMFPLKCPMHYEGCKGGITAKLARRVLNENLYQRFLEFSDRATFGDGMRCIFCNHFVNFPVDMSRISRVQCPHCTQRFCVRCRKPWHAAGKCPMETADESVEVWKASSGAQKCPSCKKVIEKADSETCNHMVHKLTDAIPCIRDRTDFCYMCGEEVEEDYPHDEVKNPGVNHFPDGVFQKCRMILYQEREAERERLRKQKRMKSNTQTPGSSKKSSVLPAEGIAWELDPLMSPVTSPSRTRAPTAAIATEGALQSFDVEEGNDPWNLALAQAISASLQAIPEQSAAPVSTPSVTTAAAPLRLVHPSPTMNALRDSSPQRTPTVTATAVDTPTLTPTTLPLRFTRHSGRN